MFYFMFFKKVYVFFYSEFYFLVLFIRIRVSILSIFFFVVLFTCIFLLLLFIVNYMFFKLYVFLMIFLKRCSFLGFFLLKNSSHTYYIQNFIFKVIILLLEFLFCYSFLCDMHILLLINILSKDNL